MGLIEKAKELGRELRNTDEYKEMERTNDLLKQDAIAQQLVQEIQDVQQRIVFAQQSGVQPTQEQIEEFNRKRETLHTNITVMALLKAQNNFNQVMQEVNAAIAEGIREEVQKG